MIAVRFPSDSSKPGLEPGLFLGVARGLPQSGQPGNTRPPPLSPGPSVLIAPYLLEITKSVTSEAGPSQSVRHAKGRHGNQGKRQLSRDRASRDKPEPPMQACRNIGVGEASVQMPPCLPQQQLCVKLSEYTRDGPRQSSFVAAANSRTPKCGAAATHAIQMALERGNPRSILRLKDVSLSGSHVC